jgi:pyruvyltransferase
MNLKFKYNKFINEVKSEGIRTAFDKTNKHLRKKLRKASLTNLIKSSKTIFSKEHVIVTWSSDAEVKNNFGDALNPILINHITNKKPYNYKDIINIKHTPVYSVVGSILDNKNINNLEVWGSGFMYEDGKFKTLPKIVHAVRGPLTRELILNQGVHCPEVYGDPGLLVSKIYNPNFDKEYKLGIIPHYIDKGNKYLLYLKEKYPSEVLIIDIQDSFKNVIDNVNRCELIASSSLHGVITADAYNIPSLWIKLSDNVNGGNFKYRDYMLSVGREQMEPVVLNKRYRLSEFTNEFSKYHLNIDLEKLLQACPFME